MIVITGTAGFIGSNIIRKLNELGRDDLVISDDDVGPYLENGKVYNIVHRDFLLQWLYLNASSVDVVIHMGARTDTMSTDRDEIMELNYEFTKALWLFCDIYKVKLVYASSAGTYGDGKMGFDDEKSPEGLKPLNFYTESKQRFDLWALSSMSAPSEWVGLKFFNVYGPREQHKGKMASMAYQTYAKIKRKEAVNLFMSPIGEPCRDFIYVDDVVNVVLFFALRKIKSNGLYNVGTGETHTFMEVAKLMFKEMGEDLNVKLTMMPAKIRGKYQFYTKAETKKLRKAGYKRQFTSLDDGIKKYVKYLETQAKRGLLKA